MLSSVSGRGMHREDLQQPQVQVQLPQRGGRVRRQNSDPGNTDKHHFYFYKNIFLTLSLFGVD